MTHPPVPLLIRGSHLAHMAGAALLSMLMACAAAPHKTAAPAPMYGGAADVDAAGDMAPAVQEAPSVAPAQDAPSMAPAARGMPARPAPRSAPAPARSAPASARSTSTGAGAESNRNESKQEFAGDKVRIEQMLIFTGQLDLRVEEGTVAKLIDQVVETATQMGGYISQQDNTSVTVRVPSARFRDALGTMATYGEVASRSVQAQDVSEQYYDLGVRLQSLKATRQRLEEFLKRAKNIQEVLRLEQELSRLAGEIDKIEGRMRFLAARAAFSTITVRFIPQPKVQTVVDRPPPPPPPPPPPRTVPLPIDWLNNVGVDSLLDMR